VFRKTDGQSRGDLSREGAKERRQRGNKGVMRKKAPSRRRETGGSGTRGEKGTARQTKNKEGPLGKESTRGGRASSKYSGQSRKAPAVEANHVTGEADQGRTGVGKGGLSNTEKDVELSSDNTTAD